MTPLRVFIVDDEPLARLRLRELLNDCATELPLICSGEAASGAEALERLAETPSDVVLLDIRMPGMDGTELARQLALLSPPPAVIFTTAYDSYALQAFDLHAADYLLKPIRRARLLEALLRLRQLEHEEARVHAPRTHLTIRERGQITLLPLDEVRYLRAEQKYVTVRTAKQEFLLDEPLNALEQEFGERFVRIHRNCLVAMAAITGLERVADAGEAGWQVRLNGLDERLPVSRRQLSALKHLLRKEGNP